MTESPKQKEYSITINQDFEKAILTDLDEALSELENKINQLEFVSNNNCTPQEFRLMVRVYEMAKRDFLSLLKAGR